MTYTYSFDIFRDDWTDELRLRKRVHDTVRRHRARLTDPRSSRITFADLYTSLAATLKAAAVPDPDDMARGMLLMALDRCATSA